MKCNHVRRYYTFVYSFKYELTKMKCVFFIFLLQHCLIFYAFFVSPSSLMIPNAIVSLSFCSLLKCFIFGPLSFPFPPKHRVLLFPTVVT